jgi:hypothetical protein
MIDRDGTEEARKRLGVARHTMERAALGGTIQRGTVALLTKALAAAGLMLVLMVGACSLGDIVEFPTVPAATTSVATGHQDAGNAQTLDSGQAVYPDALAAQPDVYTVPTAPDAKPVTPDALPGCPLVTVEWNGVNAWTVTNGGTTAAATDFRAIDYGPRPGLTMSISGSCSGSAFPNRCGGLNAGGSPNLIQPGGSCVIPASCILPRVPHNPPGAVSPTVTTWFTDEIDCGPAATWGTNTVREIRTIPLQPEQWST